VRSCHKVQTYYVESNRDLCMLLEFALYELGDWPRALRRSPSLSHRKQWSPKFIYELKVTYKAFSQLRKQQRTIVTG
jgi:hypothetical protein